MDSSMNNNEHVAIIGALGTVNRTVKLYDDKENPFYKLIGTDSIPHNETITNI